MEYKIIGLMSGTSLDGLDVAFVHFQKDGERWNYKILQADSIPYSKEWQEKLRGSYYQTAEGITMLHAEYGRYLGERVKEFVAKYNLKDVDFVALKGDKILYVQATYLMIDEQTIEREYSPLEAISDNYEKMVVSLDDIQFPQRNGIKHEQIWKFQA